MSKAYYHQSTDSTSDIKALLSVVRRQTAEIDYLEITALSIFHSSCGPAVPAPGKIADTDRRCIYKRAISLLHASAPVGIANIFYRVGSENYAIIYINALIIPPGSLIAARKYEMKPEKWILLPQRYDAQRGESIKAECSAGIIIGVAAFDKLLDGAVDTCSKLGILGARYCSVSGKAAACLPTHRSHLSSLFTLLYHIGIQIATKICFGAIGTGAVREIL